MRTKLSYTISVLCALATGFAATFFLTHGAQFSITLVKDTISPIIYRNNTIRILAEKYEAPSLLSGDLNRVSSLPNITSSYEVSSKNKVPSITATSYILADLETGEIILQKNEDVVRPIASLTKLMTSRVSLSAINQAQFLKVSRKAQSTYGETGDLRIGEKLKASDLLYPLLLESSNDAAEVFAESVGRKQFIDRMNEEAEMLGLEYTHFVDPSGLHPQNVSTATDLFQLSRYLYQNDPLIFDISRKKNYQILAHRWASNSKFVNDSNYLGGKNGYTDEANHTLVGIFAFREFRNHPIALILLGSQNKESDARALISYARKNVVYYDTSITETNEANIVSSGI